MKLNYTITAEDFREATTSMTPQVSWLLTIYSLLVWPFAFVTAVYDAVPIAVLYPQSHPFALQASGQGFARQNLWVAISPSLCMTTYLLISLLIAPLSSPHIAPASRRPVAQYLPLLGLLWVWPAMSPDLSIGWNPSDGNVLWAAFSPWLLYFGAARVVFIWRRKRRVQQAWRNAVSLQRPNEVEVTASGVSADDGVTAHRYQWSSFKRFGETANLLLLTTEDGLTLFIAKRAVPDASSMDELKMLIHENIREGRFATRRNAFPVILPVTEVAPAE